MKLKIFIRWDKSHDDAGGKVEVMQDQFATVWSRSCGNDDRVYGYCMALVDMLRFQGYEIDMPNCLQRHLCLNRERED